MKDKRLRVHRRIQHAKWKNYYPQSLL